MEEGKKKEGFFKRLGKDLRLQVGFCVASVLVLVAVYFPLSVMLENRTLRSNAYNLEVSVVDYAYAGIASVQSVDERITIKGWAACLDSGIREIKIVLRDTERENIEPIVLDSKLIRSEDNQNNLNYLQIDGAGFVSVVDNVIHRDTCYEIQVYLEYKRADYRGDVKISTHQYLYNNVLYDYIPMNYVAPNISDERMVEIIEEGTLFGYEKEYGAWGYLYNGDIFLILDKNIANNSAKDMYMFCHLRTTHLDLLPEERVQLGFDNYDFRFDKWEIDCGCECEYRIAKIELKKDYPITYISIGDYYGGENKWSFRFLYEKD